MLKKTTFIIFTALSIIAGAQDDLPRGEYLVRIMGCNDCHTPMYGMKAGKIAPSQWLIGNSVGFMGPWGTSYPTNLRQTVYRLSEEQWIAYIEGLQTRPPMPYYDLKKATKEDLKEIYKFIRSLGESKNVVPEALPPGKKPKTPYIDFDVKNLK